MALFKKNKISIGVILLLVSLQSYATQDIDETVLFDKKENIGINKSEVLVNKNLNDLDGLYNIYINQEFKILGDISSDKNNIYISTKYLNEDIMKKFNFTNHSIDKNGEKLIVINRDMLKDINNNDMTMSVLLNSEYFSDEVIVKKINYVKKEELKVDKANIVNYLDNNYQIYLNDGKNLSASLDTKYSNKNYWSIQNKMFYQDSKVLRGKTVYKKDFEDKSSLQIGDIIEDGLGQNVSVNGLGFKYSTNYFNNYSNSNLNDSLPQFSVGGFSLTPSMFNLYSTSSALIKSEIKSGNYDIIMPYNNGYGTYTGYIKDSLGNIQEFNIPYYNNLKLLKEGGLEYSVSAAKIRMNPQTESFNYEKPFISGIAKYGVTKSWTQDLSVHYSEYFKNIYTGSNFYIQPNWGLFKLGVNYNGDNQSLYNLGWEYYSNSPLNFKFDSSFSKDSEGFCIKYVNDCIKKQNRYYVGYKLPQNLGILSLQHLEEKKNYTDYTSNTLNWSKSINNRLNISMSYENIRNNEKKSENKFTLLMNYSFDQSYSSGLNYSKSDNNSYYQTRVSKNENKEHPEYGYGYVSMDGSSNRNNTNYSLNYNANLDKFSYGVQLRNVNNNLYSKLGMRGSVLYIPEDNYISLNKRTSGIILVDTDKKVGQDDTPLEILHQNKVSGSTDKNGKYTIVNAIPYTQQKVELNLQNLPIDRNYEVFKQEIVVPEYGAAKVKFIQLLGDFDISVKNIPPGAIFKIDDKSYVVGKNNEASVDKEGLAKYESDSLTCTFNVKTEQKEYTCE